MPSADLMPLDIHLDTFFGSDLAPLGDLYFFRKARQLSSFVVVDEAAATRRDAEIEAERAFDAQQQAEHAKRFGGASGNGPGGAGSGGSAGRGGGTGGAGGAGGTGGRGGTGAKGAKGRSEPTKEELPGGAVMVKGVEMSPFEPCYNVVLRLDFARVGLEAFTMSPLIGSSEVEGYLDPAQADSDLALALE
eukprot:s2133_g6.t1